MYLFYIERLVSNKFMNVYSYAENTNTIGCLKFIVSFLNYCNTYRFKIVIFKLQYRFKTKIVLQHFHFSQYDITRVYVYIYNSFCFLKNCIGNMLSKYQEHRKLNNSNKFQYFSRKVFFFLS